MADDSTVAAMAKLAAALRQRLAVIEDHAWRDRDPEGHLSALKAISERIDQATEAVRPVAPSALRHFLTSRSYDKALRFLEASGVDGKAGGE